MKYSNVLKSISYFGGISTIGGTYFYCEWVKDKIYKHDTILSGWDNY